MLKKKFSKQQLCQFKNTYLRNTIYYSEGAYFSVKPKKKELNHPILSLIILRDGHHGFFTKSPWKLVGVKMNIELSKRNNSVTQRFKFIDEDNKFKMILCSASAKECKFQVRYTGDLNADIQKTGSNNLSFDSNKYLKVTFHDSNGYILHFPKNCDTLI